jgi:hypothetical protein
LSGGVKTVNSINQINRSISTNALALALHDAGETEIGDLEVDVAN